ncbi:ATP-binding protein [Cryobacterium sp. M15]|uniref:ATP-binding protein n=1 Tax=Cryobacterium sp. M15 TaxID=2048291 RepID=UPI000CE53B58|nr:ATP-binding protein [Cryobacterium sp. M15]
MALKIVAPNTSRLVEGLRDTGYTFNASISDIVDNSVANDAGIVHISIDLDSMLQLSVRIADDGCGMDRTGLENAMKYGSDQQNTPNSLSKFGMGLKTASTAFCRKLSLISLSEESGEERIHFATWDLDVLTARGEWLLDEGPAEPDQEDEFNEAMARIANFGSLATPSSGTLVLWEKVDRLLKTKHGKDPVNSRRFVDDMVGKLRLHIAMVFQRFLDEQDERARNVKIYVNAVPVVAWDPFCAKWISPVDPGEVKYWRFEGSSGDQQSVICRSYILPPRNEIDDEAYGTSVKISNQSQGIFLYRENRLIDGPSWLGLVGTSETHMNNLRIELSFPGELDDVFGVGIKKSGVHLDANFSSELNKYLAPIRNEAINRSRRGKAKAATTAGGADSPGRPSERTIASALKSLDIAVIAGQDDGSVVLTGNQGSLTILDSAGMSTGHIAIFPNDDTNPVFVQRKDNLENGSLWEGSYIPGKGIGVSLNTGHSWYRKAYLPNSTNSPLVQAIEYLFFALAQAEQNNTTHEMKDNFDDFRAEVSMNLNKLMRDLPEPAEIDPI